MNGKASPQLVIPNNTGIQLLPNKSTLFASSSPQPQQQPQSPSFNMSGNSASSPVPPKPTINYGKPNLAPKPPGMTVQVPGNGTNAPARPTVARHQSMRSPRYAICFLHACHSCGFVQFASFTCCFCSVLPLVLGRPPSPWPMMDPCSLQKLIILAQFVLGTNFNRWTRLTDRSVSNTLLQPFNAPQRVKLN